jgi:hypothetical protein
MRYFELLSEGAADAIIPEIEALGYNDVVRKSGTTVNIFAPTADRKKVYDTLLQQLEGSVKKTGGPSTLGYIEYKNAKIVVRPAGKQGVESAGIKNEQNLIDKINEFVKEVGPLDITFVGDNGVSITAKAVTEAAGVGRDTAGRKKSDVNLLSNGKAVPISIKKRTAEYWESADTYFGDLADKVLTKLIKEKQIDVLPIEGEFRPSDGKQKIRIKPEVAVETTDEQTADLVFGSDLLAGQGGVIKETFEDEHYTLRANNLTVTCDVVIKDPKDIPDRMKVFMLVRNSKDRNRPSSPYPGTKVQAAYASRAKNALILDQDLNIIRQAKSRSK